MPLTKLIDDVKNISKLADEPNDVDGLTAAELKAEFDKAGETIKVYLNDTLVMELDAQFAAQAAENEKLEGAIADLVAVSIPDGSVTETKLADGAVSHRALGLNVVEKANIADGAVGETELANNAVSTDKILAKAVTDVKLADRAVTQRALGLNAVWAGNIKDREVKAPALGDAAVISRTIAEGAVTNEKIAKGAVYGAKLQKASNNRLGGVIAAESSPSDITLEIFANGGGRLFGDADQIISHNVTSTWESIKYRSGLALCWLQRSMETAINSPDHYMYNSDKYFGAVDYPFPFKTPPLEISMASPHSAVFTVAAGANSTTASCIYLLYKSTADPDVHKHTLNTIVFGRWK